MYHSNYLAHSLSLLYFMYYFMFISFCTVTSQKHSKIPKLEDIPYLENALQEGLTYLRNHNDTKTLDVALGVTLVKGNLRWITDRLKHEGRFRRKISELLELCKRIFSEMYRVFQVSENSRERTFSALLARIFDDIAAEDVQYGRLIRNVEGVELPIFENCSFITDHIMKGTPNDSDACILELFDKSCNASSSCWFQETNHLDNAGYKTSHRLLYLQLAMKLNCGKGDERRMKTMKTSICQRMLEEATALYGKNVFFARDLFLEQIALCGFEGYAEFADRDWSTEIPRWQNSVGCFGVLRGEQLPEESCPGWRSDLNRREDLCSAHLTAVAISAIAFHLRVAFDQF